MQTLNSIYESPATAATTLCRVSANAQSIYLTFALPGDVTFNNYFAFAIAIVIPLHIERDSPNPIQFSMEAKELNSWYRKLRGRERPRHSERVCIYPPFGYPQVSTGIKIWPPGVKRRYTVNPDRSRHLTQPARTPFVYIGMYPQTTIGYAQKHSLLPSALVRDT